MRANEWHLRDPEAAASNLKTDLYKGLSEKEALRRQRKNGKNDIWHVQRASATRYALQTVGELTTVLLIITALIAAVFESSKFAAVICVILAAGIVLRVSTYIKAKRIFETMADEGIPNATVLRDSKTRVIRADEIVVGDIILLGEGDIVPCDGRIVAGDMIKVSEKGITENKTSVIKRDTVIISDVDGAEIPCEYRVNMLFAGSVILSGSCRIAVTACSDETLVCMKQGGITVPSGEKLPVIERFSSWCRTGNLIMLALVIALSGISLVFSGTARLTDTFLNMIALTVSSTSGYLSAVGYIIVAVPVRRAAVGDSKKKGCGRAVIKDCSCIEEIAGVNRIVISDISALKSGSAAFSSFYHNGKLYRSGEGSPDELIGLAMATVCDTGRDFDLSDKQENAANSKKMLINKIAKSASDIYKRKMQYELSVLDHAYTNDEYEGALDTSILYRGSDLEAVVSGSVYDVLRICDTYKKNGHEAVLSAEERKSILDKVCEIQNMGGSVIAVAARTSPYTTIKRISFLHSKMCFEGFIASFEEPAQNLSDAMSAVKNAGMSIAVMSDRPELEIGYLIKHGVINQNAEILNYKDFLSDDVCPKGDFMIKVPSYVDESLKKTGISDIRCSAVGKILKCEGDIAVITKEALDSRMMNGGSIGAAVRKSDNRPIPQTLKRRSKITVYPSSKSEYGGFTETFKAICESLCALRNLHNAALYIVTSQTAKIVCAFAAAFLGSGLINAVGILLLGFIYDFVAVLVMAFEEGTPSDLKEKNVYKSMPSGKSVASSAAFGVIWGLLCCLVPLAGIIQGNLQSAFESHEAPSAVMISMILCQLVVSSEYMKRGGSILKARGMNTAHTSYICLSFLSAALFMLSSRFCMLIGASSPSLMLTGAAVLCSVLIFAACEIFKLVKRKMK